MAESYFHQTVLAAEDVLRTEIIVNQALIDILIAKKIITEDELVNTIRNIRHEQGKLLNKSNKIFSFKQR